VSKGSARQESALTAERKSTEWRTSAGTGSHRPVERSGSPSGLAVVTARRRRTGLQPPAAAAARIGVKVPVKREKTARRRRPDTAAQGPQGKGGWQGAGAPGAGQPWQPDYRLTAAAGGRRPWRAGRQGSCARVILAGPQRGQSSRARHGGQSEAGGETASPQIRKRAPGNGHRCRRTTNSRRGEEEAQGRMPASGPP